MRVRDVIRIIEKDGWFIVRQTGSHQQYHHPNKPGTVTVSVHRLSDELHPKTLKSIFKQAQVSDE
ncbi:MAG: type II toxin-antitoxin system HicA family toxin [Spirochaetota bacterium]